MNQGSSRRVPLRDASKHFVNRPAEDRRKGSNSPQPAAPLQQQQPSQQVSPQQQTDVVAVQAPSQLAQAAAAAAAVQTMMTGNELRDWQQSWRRIMRVSVVYFDESFKKHYREVARVTAAFKRLGAHIVSFFSDNVTVIVSERPYNKHGDYPNGDIFRKARQRELKVWNYDKVCRFMQHLGESVHDDASEKLSLLLRNEKLFGPNDRDPSAKRDDIKYFANLFLYAYDLRQQTRPVAVREWGRNSEYPRLCRSTNGRSLFIEDPKPHSTNSQLKRHARRMLYLEETKGYRDELIAASYKGTTDEPLNYDQRCQWRLMFERLQQADREQRAAHDLKLQQQQQQQQQQQHEPPPSSFGKPSLLPPEDDVDNGSGNGNDESRSSSVMAPVKKTVVSTAVPASLNREDSVVSLGAAKFKNDYGEIQASGVQNQSGSNALVAAGNGNGLAPSYSEVHNKKIANDQKKTMVFGSKLSPSKARIVEVDKENIVPKKLALEKVQEQALAVTPTRQITPSYEAALKEQQQEEQQEPERCHEHRHEHHHESPEKAPDAAMAAQLKHAELVKMKEKKRKHDREEQAQQKRPKRESKPGYCENCRVKYADFEEHIRMNKHRQFAVDDSNFEEIDRLIDTVKMTQMMGL